MVGVIGVVVNQLSFSFQLRSLLDVNVVNPSSIVMCCLLHQLLKTLLSEMACDKVVGLPIQADVEVARDEDTFGRVDKLFQFVSNLPQTSISRSIDMDGVQKRGRKHGHLEVWSFHVPDMLEGGFAEGDKSFARANAHKGGLVTIQLKPELMFLALHQPALTDVDQISLHHGRICCQVLHVRLQSADVERCNPKVSSRSSPGVWVVVERSLVHFFTFGQG